jgi:hypothetical protein
LSSCYMIHYTPFLVDHVKYFFALSFYYSDFKIPEDFQMKV